MKAEAKRARRGMVAQGCRGQQADGGTERHATQQRILDLLEGSGGIIERQLVDRLQLARGTVRYHLRILCDAGLVESRSPGKRAHFFPAGTPQEDVRRLAKARSGRAWDVLRQVLVEPGLSQSELSERLDIDRKVLRGHLSALEDVDLVAPIRRGRAIRYIAGTAIDPGLARNLGVERPLTKDSPQEVETRLWELEHPRRAPRGRE